MTEFEGALESMNRIPGAKQNDGLIITIALTPGSVSDKYDEE